MQTTETLKVIKLASDTEFLDFVRYLRIDLINNRHDKELINNAIQDRMLKLHKSIEYGCCGTNYIRDL